MINIIKLLPLAVFIMMFGCGDKSPYDAPTSFRTYTELEAWASTGQFGGGMEAHKSGAAGIYVIGKARGSGRVQPLYFLYEDRNDHNIFGHNIIYMFI